MESKEVEQAIPNLCPHPDDLLMAGAWASCLSYTITQPEWRRAFESDTGRAPIFQSRTVLEAMIDRATGYERDVDMHGYVHAFILWFNENVWGDPYAPDEDDE